MNRQVRPSLFIGSSSEGLRIAKAIQANLEESCETTLWSQGVFGLGEGTLESLVSALDMYDFAALVLTPDDLLDSRAKRIASPRDNVLLEVGLFTGGLGRQRTFIVFDRTAKIKLPSDLAGVTAATFQPHVSQNWIASVGPACTRIEAAIQKLGPRRRLEAASDICTVDVYYHPTGFIKARADVFAAQMEGAGFKVLLHEHDARVADAVFIGALVRADEARTVLGAVPYPVKFIFRPDYPESEGGDLNGRKIGVGYAGHYNEGRRGERSIPAPVSQAELRKLLDPKCSNAEFHVLLHSFTFSGSRR